MRWVGRVVVALIAVVVAGAGQFLLPDHEPAQLPDGVIEVGVGGDAPIGSNSETPPRSIWPGGGVPTDDADEPTRPAAETVPLPGPCQAGADSDDCEPDDEDDESAFEEPEYGEDDENLGTAEPHDESGEDAQDGP